mgnify:CR=1 FL=1|tara:strand:- start:1641 stop:1979 length:339 start_codon:yes stop_codon:yes gene_type:complete
MNWTFNDGGRLDAGLHGLVKDCAARAEAILFDVPYLKALDNFAGAMPHTYLDNILNNDGWSYIEAKPDTVVSNLEGTVVAVLDKHYTVVINNQINDIFDTSEKVVYSYWSKN